jgi:hypothetical protein
MLNVSFIFTGYLNGRPTWTSTQYGMQIVWLGFYWEIANWPYDGVPTNYTDTNIPLTGWQLIGSTSITADFTVNLGECCFEYSFVNGVSGSTLSIDYTDCNYARQNLNIPFGISGSFCATSIDYASNTGSYSLSGNICSEPSTNCFNFNLTGPVTVYYTDCNGVLGNIATVASGSSGSICAFSINAWNNVNNFSLQGNCPPSPTPSITPTISISATPYITPSVTPTITPSKTPSISVSKTPSVTPSISISTTPGVSITPSITPSTTPSITPSITPSVSGLIYTFITIMSPSAPCNPEYNIYLGNNGNYYASDDGGTTYTLMYSITEFWFELIGYDPNFLADVFTSWTINSTSTVLTDEGNLLQNC